MVATAAMAEEAQTEAMEEGLWSAMEKVNWLVVGYGEEVKTWGGCYLLMYEREGAYLKG